MISVIGIPDLVPAKLVGSLVIEEIELDRERVRQGILLTSPELTSAHHQVDRAQLALEVAERNKTHSNIGPIIS